MAFTDNFTGSSGDYLESRTGWTLVDGDAGAAQINASNELKGVSTSATNGYQCTDQSTPDHYTKADILSAASGFVSVRVTNGSNFIGARYFSTVWQIYKRVSGSFTLLGSYTTSLTSGDTLELIADSSDNITAKVNDVTRIGPVSETFNNTETRQGLCPRSVAIDPWIDNFEAGALAGGGPAIPTLIQNMRGCFQNPCGGFING